MNCLMRISSIDDSDILALNTKRATNVVRRFYLNSLYARHIAPLDLLKIKWHIMGQRDAMPSGQEGVGGRLRTLTRTMSSRTSRAKVVPI
jgi:hypothetical protein